MKLSLSNKIIALIVTYIVLLVVFYFFRDWFTFLPIVAGVAFMFFYVSLFADASIHVGKAFGSFLVGSALWYVFAILIFGLNFSRFLA